MNSRTFRFGCWLFTAFLVLLLLLTATYRFLAYIQQQADTWNTSLREELRVWWLTYSDYFLLGSIPVFAMSAIALLAWWAYRKRLKFLFGDPDEK